MGVLIEKINEKTNVAALVEEIVRDQVSNLSKDSKIVIKPNICSPKSPDTGVTTHHEIVKGVLEALRDFREVILVESNTTSSDFDVNVKGWNPSFIDDYKNARLVNLSDEDTHIRKLKGIDKTYEVEMAKLLDDYDYFIDLPVLKTHIHARISVGIKNLFGLLSVKNKSLFHLDIHDLLIGLVREFKPDLTIVDAIQGLEGQGPIFGEPANAGLILAGNDVIEVDYTASKIVGVDPFKVKYLNSAMNEFQKSYEEDESLKNVLDRKFNTSPTLLYQVANALTLKDEVSLKEVQENIDVPDQTKRNLPTLLKTLVYKGIITHDDSTDKYKFDNVGYLNELFPETNSIFKDKKIRR